MYKLILELPFNVTLVHRGRFNSVEDATRWGQEHLPAPFQAVSASWLNGKPDLIYVPLQQESRRTH